jgi:hypothetical protein
MLQPPGILALGTFSSKSLLGVIARRHCTARREREIGRRAKRGAAAKNVLAGDAAAF